MLEFRIVNLRYDAVSTDVAPYSSAIVFDIQMRAGANYIGSYLPMGGAEVFIKYDAGPGVTIHAGAAGPPSVTFMKVKAPVPNPVNIMNLSINPYPYAVPGIYGSAIRISYARYYSLSKPEANNFTHQWVNTATCYIPVSGPVDYQTCFTILSSQDWPFPPATSAWSSGLSPQPGTMYNFKAPCPSIICIGDDPNAIFTFPLEYCEGEPAFTLPTASNNLNPITGTWNKPQITTSKVGLDTIIFIPDLPGFCVDTMTVTVKPYHKITVGATLAACGGTPYNLISAVTVPANEIASDYKFYTHNGISYVSVSPAIGLVKWAAGTYRYYARYENPDSCFSNYTPFDVVVTAPPTPTATAQCDGSGEITHLTITGPIHVNYRYSLDNVSYYLDTDPAIVGPHSPALTAPHAVFVKDLISTCVSMDSIDCPPCANPPIITLTSGTGRVCIDGTYSLSGSYVDADSVVVTHNGTGSLAVGTFYPTVGLTSGTFTAVYTPGALDVSGAVTLTFTVPATAFCPVETKTATFNVNPLPTIGTVSATFTEFNCTNSTLPTTLSVTLNAAWTYLWSAGIAPLNTNSVNVNFSQVAVGGTTFTVAVTNIATGCVNTASITLTKDITPPLPPAVNSYQEFCAVATVEDLTPNGAGIIWYNAPTLGAGVPAGTALIDGNSYYAAQVGANGCESAIRSAIKVGIVDPADLGKPTIETQNLCIGALVSDIKTDGSTGIVFFTPYPAAAELLPTDVLSTGGTYLAIYRYGIGVGACKSADTTKFNIILDATAANPPTITTPQIFCSGAMISDIDVPYTGIIWYDDNNPASSPLAANTPLTAKSYWAAQNKGGSCVESSRVAVQINMGAPLPPTTYEPYEICAPATLGNVKVTGYGIEWYASLGGAAIPDITPLSMGIHTYWVAQTGSATCSSARIPVVITIKNCAITDLIDCSVMGHKTVQEDAFKAGKYTHSGTGWDAVSVIANPLDKVEYYINGTLFGLTLDGAEFLLGISTVQAIAYYDTITHTCTFTVTVERICPTVSDADGSGFTYPVIGVGGLCWTANLKATKYTDGSNIEFAEPYSSSMYPDIVANTNNFGLLYTWYSAMKVDEGDDTQIPATNQGICPNGWHVPTQAEFNQLNVWEAVDLKSTNYWITPGTNLSFYDSRGAGKYDAATDRYIDLLGTTTYWSCEGVDKGATGFSLTYYTTHCQGMSTTIPKIDGLSVRCVWD